VVLPRAFFLHADHGHQPVPGLPCALSLLEGPAYAKLGRRRRRENARVWLFDIGIGKDLTAPGQTWPNQDDVCVTLDTGFGYRLPPVKIKRRAGRRFATLTKPGRQNSDGAARQSPALQ
jgi:hypothetical protein